MIRKYGKKTQINNNKKCQKEYHSVIIEIKGIEININNFTTIQLTTQIKWTDSMKGTVFKGHTRIN